jgi:Na+-driven multidrug efflux pump
MTNDRSSIMGEAGIPQLLLTFSIPAIIGMLAQGLYNVVDRVIVGHAIGSNGIAGTTVALPYMLVLLAFGMLIGFGATALVSIRLGQGRRDEAEHVLGNAVFLMLGISVILTAAGLAFLDDLLRLFGASDTVLPYARDYLHVIALGTVFQIVGFGLTALIRGEGNPRIAMLTMIISVVLMMLFPAQIIRLFNRQDPMLVGIGGRAIRISVCVLPLVGFQIISASYFQAVGKPRHAMFLGLSRQVLLLMPAVVILPRFFGLDGLWAAFPTADLCASVLTGIWLAAELRHLHKNHEETLAPAMQPAETEQA